MKYWCNDVFFLIIVIDMWKINIMFVIYIYEYEFEFYYWWYLWMFLMWDGWVDFLWDIING